MSCRTTRVILSFLLLSLRLGRAIPDNWSSDFHQPNSGETARSPILKLPETESPPEGNTNHPGSQDQGKSSPRETQSTSSVRLLQATPPSQRDLTYKKAIVVRRSSPGGTGVSLSLDVPLGILRILIDMAKAKALRARAAANAELMKQIGRRR